MILIILGVKSNCPFSIFIPFLLWSYLGHHDLILDLLPILNCNSIYLFVCLSVFVPKHTQTQTLMLRSNFTYCRGISSSSKVSPVPSMLYSNLVEHHGPSFLHESVTAFVKFPYPKSNFLEGDLFKSCWTRSFNH